MATRFNLLLMSVLCSEAHAITFYGQYATADVQTRVLNAQAGSKLRAIATLDPGDGAYTRPEGLHRIDSLFDSPEINAQQEAAMFNRTAQEKDPVQKLALVEEFEHAYPNSRYQDAARYLRFLGLRDSGDANAALAAAQSILARNPTREDVLFYTAHRFYTEGRELSTVVDYCYTVIAILEVRTKPEALPEAAWIEQRDSALLQAHWLKGAAHLQRNEWEQADKSLRSALQLSKAGSGNTPAVVSSLGWANYKMRRIPEAIRLYDQCSQATGYYAASCKQTAAYIKNEYALQ